MKDLIEMAKKREDEAEYLRLIAAVVSIATTCAYTGFGKSDQQRQIEAVGRLATFEKDHQID